MHSPLEIAKNFIEIGIHKVRLSAWKMIFLGIFAGIFIGFAGIAATIASATIENPSLSRLLAAMVFPAGLAMVLTPKDIDAQVERISRLLGYGISLGLHRGLRLEDVTCLLG